jgi:hypothetical protein
VADGNVGEGLLTRDDTLADEADQGSAVVGSGTDDSGGVHYCDGCDESDGIDGWLRELL